ncbi:MAG: CoA transferase [Gammaproteobacteria bacterium]
MIDTAYAGTRVIEIASRLTAGVTGRFFADFGADVLRVELFEEPPARPAERAALAWARLNKQVLVPPAGQWGAADLQALASEADLVITDLVPQQWAQRFPTPESIAAAHPRLVFLNVSTAGRSGPYADYLTNDLVTLAMSGYMFVSGLNEREPLRIGVELVEIVTGVNAAGGAMIALHHARHTGQGQVVDVSDLETFLGSGLTFNTTYGFTGAVKRRSPTRILPIGALVPCADGHVLLSTFRAVSDLLFVMLEDERILEDRFADIVGREMHQKDLYRIYVDALAHRKKEEIFHTGQGIRLQHAMVQMPGETPACPQHGERRFFQPLTLDDGRQVQAPLLPSFPAALRGPVRPPAMVDRSLWREPRTPPPAPVATPTRRALEGLKVLELTFAWAGPFIGRMFADHGAQVVKIESRHHPDTAKGTDSVDMSFGDNGRWLDRSAAYMIASPDKYHLGMELSEPIGKEVALDLVRWADVVIENFKPSVLPKFGLGWDVLQKINPRLVMISSTGFGHSGAYKDYGAWGWGLESMGGVTGSTGYRDDPTPMAFQPTIPDSFSATLAITAVLAALEERRRTGKGQWVELSQYEGATFATLLDVLRAGIAGADRPRPGNRHAWRAPHGVYPCRGRDAWVAIGVDTDAQWLRLCEVIGRADLGADAALSTHDGRLARHDEIDAAIARWTRTRAKRRAMEILQAAGVPAGAVLHSRDLHHDAHVRGLEFWRAAWATETGLRIYPGPWYRLQATPGDVRRGISNFGEDNERVLRELLGYDAARVKRVLDSGVMSGEQGGLQAPTSPGLPVQVQLERGYLLSWDADYKKLPAAVARRNQRWRRRHGLPPIRLDGR